MESSDILTFEHISIAYDGKTVIEDLSFTLHQGEVLAIVGESGSGKTSLLKAMMGFLEPEGMITQGDIRYKGRSLLRLPHKERRQLLGKEMASISQDVENALCPIRTIGAQLYETVKAHERCTKEEVQQRAMALMKNVGLADPYRVWKSYPFELSGGMNQRVGIVMALLLRPTLLLADEPTSALDVLVQQEVLQEIQRMKQDLGQTMIWVTHQMEVAKQVADQILVLQKGHVVEQGMAKDIWEAPKEAYTKELLAAVLRLE